MKMLTFQGDVAPGPSALLRKLFAVGLMAMPRSPIKSGEDAESAEIDEEGGSVDASLLPPG